MIFNLKKKKFVCKSLYPMQIIRKLTLIIINTTNEIIIFNFYVLKDIYFATVKIIMIDHFALLQLVLT